MIRHPCPNPSGAARDPDGIGFHFQFRLLITERSVLMLEAACFKRRNIDLWLAAEKFGITNISLHTMPDVHLHSRERDKMASLATMDTYQNAQFLNWVYMTLAGGQTNVNNTSLYSDPWSCSNTQPVNTVNTVSSLLKFQQPDPWSPNTINTYATVRICFRFLKLKRKMHILLYSFIKKKNKKHFHLKIFKVCA